MKTCTNCNLEKPLSDFSRRKSGYQFKCKECDKAYKKTWYDLNKEKHKAKVLARKKGIQNEPEPVPDAVDLFKKMTEILNNPVMPEVSPVEEPIMQTSEEPVIVSPNSSFAKLWRLKK